MGNTYRRGDSKSKRFDDYSNDRIRQVEREKRKDEMRREKANKKRMIEVEEE